MVEDDIRAADAELGRIRESDRGRRPMLIMAVDRYLADRGAEVRDDNRRRRSLKRHRRAIAASVGVNPPVGIDPISGLLLAWRIYSWTGYAIRFISWLMERRIGPPGSDPRTWGSN